ncbi:MAG: hypothetical protein ABSD68_01255 [Candidatus Micrarchaeales archaeon]
MKTIIASNQEKYHALKEVGRGTEKLAKGIAATVASGAIVAGEGYFAIKTIPTLLFEPLPNQWAHFINGLQSTGVAIVIIAGAAATYVLAPYGIGKIKEGLDELKEAKR